MDKYAENQLAQQLSMVDGVAQVNVYGSQKYAVRVQVDPQSLSAKGIGMDQVATAIANGNSNTPTGTLYGQQQNYTIESNGQLMDAAAYRTLNIAYRNGAPVQLGEIGQVLDSVENDKVASWYNGTRAIVLAIQKQPGTNTVEIVDKIKKILPNFRRQIPAAVNMEIQFDRSQPIKESIDDVQFTLMLTIALVVLVIFLFLRNLSATVIPSLAVPLSLVATFGVMLLLGYSLDNLSLMALTLSVGFVVDDAVVMLENIVRHMEMGEKPFEAALNGSREIGFTILSMTISLVAVFIPVLFLGGILGRLFREFAVTISVAILVSGFISISLTPMLCSRFLRPPQGEHDGNGGTRSSGNGNGNGRRSQGSGVRGQDRLATRGWKSGLQSFKARLYGISEGFFNGMQGAYDWSLRLSLKHHRLTMLVSGAILVATVVLFVLVPKGFIPSTDIGQITANTQAAQDISFDEMVKHQQAIAAIIQRDPNVDVVNSTVGAGGPNASANTGRIFIRLKPRHDRSLSADAVVQELRPKLTKVPGIKVFLQNPPAINIGDSKRKPSISTRCKVRICKSCTTMLPSWRKSSASSRNCRMSTAICRSTIPKLRFRSTAIRHRLWDSLPNKFKARWVMPTVLVKFLPFTPRTASIR